ncbi:MAG: succinate dehydrogenase [Planctomycetota bacterium]
MTTAPSTTPAAGSSPRLPKPAALMGKGMLAEHHFILRRLHSLTGIMPVGVFLLFHLFTNMQMALAELTGELHYFQDEVDFIHSLPALIFLEVFGLWLPIAFHAGLGIVYMLSGKNNFYSYQYGGNLRYSLQRWTAWIALIFIFYHISTLRWRWTWFGLIDTPFVARGLNDEPLAQASTALALQAGLFDGWLITAFYLLGGLAAVYHWSNGLWTAAITWGLTITQKAMKRWGMVCAGMGVALSIFTVAAVWGARYYDVTDEERAAINAYVESGGHSETQHGGDPDH